ncbi:uncharacterized protein LOC131179444 [Hevea brasiliensis]|uniref:uncharacterized protein LOC131179444 n=1 Tax=Hevea brasiliensis TaxID=3981 RepID=UPI0025F87DB7|nr:uncharacterized protein LOC131179444 [Hevea brasiliensis]
MVDSHQASTSFTFQAPIPDPTITISPTFPNNDLPISYHPAVSNAEFHPSIPIPSIYHVTNFPTKGMAYVAGGENKEKENENLSALEERLRAIEGLNMYGSVDVSSLRLVPDVVVPPKFKVPDFDKYTRNSDPRIHLATYIAKMSGLTKDDRLLVHFFHESLFGAFTMQYKFNCNVTPTPRDLQNLVQKEKESFKEYAQRWREKAAEELTGENLAKKTTSFRKKKEGDVHSITRQAQPPLPQNNFRPYPPIQGPIIANVLPPFPNYPHPRPQYPPQAAYQPKLPAQPIQLRPPAPQTNPRPPRNPDLPLPLPLSEIYRYLLVGHSTDNCGALRGRVQALIRNEWLKIEENGSLPNVTSNPLPNHGTAREGYLCPQGSGSGSNQHNSGCPYHGGAANHELHNCDEFRQEVQRMLSLRILRYQRRSGIKDEVNTARFGRDASTPNPRIVYSTPNTPTPLVPPITIILKCKGCIIAKVLIDNGSALNDLPNATLAKLSVDPSAVR